ncbi:MAG: serine hydrolase [Bacteroidales bacterium]
MKKTLIKLLFIIVIPVIVTSCYVARFFYWNKADVKDHKKFPAYPVRTGEKPFRFVSMDHIAPTLPAGFKTEGKFRDIEEFLDDKNTLAFLVIRNDTLLYEKYFNGYGRASVIPCFSIAKSVVSAMVGIAIEEGYIAGVTDLVSAYLSGFKDPSIGDITLEQLLNMRSGIKYNEGYRNPLGQVAKFYYGRDLDRYTRNLEVACPPDERYQYVSANTQILGMILEKTTGKTLAGYLEEKIWKPAGMEFDASWSYDSKKHGRTKAFCCINTTPIDLARFGRLYLPQNAGKVIPGSWIEQTLTPGTDSRDDQGYPYNYHWRIPKKNTIFAKGILGQYLYIDIPRNLIIVRMGKNDGDIRWPELFEGLTENFSQSGG